MNYVILFQFHKGTIRTVLLFLPVPILSHFNSIKVRLELHERYYQYIQHLEFQFHKGTIRTLPPVFALPFSNISIP